MKVIKGIIKIKKEKGIGIIQIQTNYDASKEIDCDKVEVITTTSIKVYFKFPTVGSKNIIFFEDRGICEKKDFDQYCNLKRKEFAIDKIDLCECIYGNFKYPIEFLYDTFDMWDY